MSRGFKSGYEDRKWERDYERGRRAAEDEDSLLSWVGTVALGLFLFALFR